MMESVLGVKEKNFCGVVHQDLKREAIQKLYKSHG